MRILLALAFVLTFTLSAQATSFFLDEPGSSFHLSGFAIPDGSTITGMTYQPPGTTATGRWSVTFTFAGGYGNAWNDFNDGGQGFIYFDTPVTNLSINWILHGAGSFTGWCYIGCPDHGTTEYRGPISSVSWWIYPGWGGIDSMSWDGDDPPDPLVSAPEVPSLALLPLGLLGLLLVRRRVQIKASN